MCKVLRSKENRIKVLKFMKKENKAVKLQPRHFHYKSHKYFGGSSGIVKISSAVNRRRQRRCATRCAHTHKVINILLITVSVGLVTTFTKLFTKIVVEDASRQ